MADNIDSKTASNVPVATDQVTYSGDANQHVQLMRLVQVTGAEGSKTVVDLPGEASNGLDVDVTRLPAPLTVTGNGAASTALRVTLANDSSGTVTEASASASLTALQLIDDVVHTDDTSTHSTSTSKGVLVMGAAAPTDAAVDANDIGAVGMTVDRAMYASVRDWAGTAAVTGSGTATGALRVELPTNGTGIVGLAQGSNVVGQVISGMTTVTATITRPANTTLYSANDSMTDGTPAVGGTTFTNCARISGGSGIITDAVFTMSDDSTTPLQGELWLYNAAVSSDQSDNTAFALTDADVLLVVGRIPFTIEDIGANGFYHATNLNLGFTCSGSANLRGQIRVRNAFQPAANGGAFQMMLKILQIN